MRGSDGSGGVVGACVIDPGPEIFPSTNTFIGAENLASQNFFWLVRESGPGHVPSGFHECFKLTAWAHKWPAARPNLMGFRRREDSGLVRTQPASGVQATVGRLSADPGPS
jgi:hypothetical protein